jgi:hypothetical protein
MKASPEEEGRIIAQSRFDVNEEISAQEQSHMRNDEFRRQGFTLQSVMRFTLGLFFKNAQR